jgi:hypothetical protein
METKREMNGRERREGIGGITTSNRNDEHNQTTLYTHMHESIQVVILVHKSNARDFSV